MTVKKEQKTNPICYFNRKKTAVCQNYEEVILSSQINISTTYRTDLMNIMLKQPIDPSYFSKLSGKLCCNFDK
jgi:hypothetical protein